MRRFGFVVRRVLVSVPLFLGVVLLVFLLLQLMPGDPARVVAGLRASPASLHQVRVQLGLDRPIYVQYGKYLWGVLNGNLGYSYKSDVAVSTQIAQHIAPTIWLIIGGTIVALVLAVPSAAASALHRDKLPDQAVRVLGAFGLTMPSFWTGIVLILIFGVKIHLFPTGGFGTTPTEHLQSIILPAVSLGIAIAPIYMRSLRSSMIDVLASDYVAAARARGIGGFSLVRKHVLRNAFSPVVTLIAINTGFLLAFGVIIEDTFNLQGIGQELVESVLQRDFPLVQGITLVFAVAVIVIFLLGDVIAALIDPRVVIES